MKKQKGYDYRTENEKKIDFLRHYLHVMIAAMIILVVAIAGTVVYFTVLEPRIGGASTPAPVPAGARRLDAGVYNVGEDIAEGAYSVLAPDRSVFVRVYLNRERYKEDLYRHNFYLNKGERLGRVDLEAGMVLSVGDPVALSPYTPEGV